MDAETEHRLTEVEARSKSNAKRIDRLEETTNVLNRLATSIEVIATKQDNISTDVNKLTAEVESLKSEPGKRWRMVVEKAILLAVAAVVGYMLSKIGL